MSWIDVKFIGLLSPKFRNFKKKTPTLYNFSCPECGDSKRNKFKARAYLIEKKGSWIFYCHNCNASMSFGNLLKSYDPFLYKQYIMEKYTSSNTTPTPEDNYKKLAENRAVNSANLADLSVLDSLMDRLDTLPDDNLAVEYAMSRKIPEEKWKDLYYLDDMKKMVQLSEKYRDRIVGSEPRLVIPYRKKDGSVYAFQCRALDGQYPHKMKYIALKLQDDYEMIYGADTVDTSQTIYVVEGPIDSMFLPNTLAVGSGALGRVKGVLPMDKCILVPDNQPKNKEIMSILRRCAKEGYKICVWPKDVLEKDINDMVLAGRTQKEIIDIIKDNSYSGLALQEKMRMWIQ